MISPPPRAPGRPFGIRRLNAAHLVAGLMFLLWGGMAPAGPRSGPDLTAEEREWITAHPEIPFTGDPNWLPYEAFDEDGNYIGIVADHLRLIERKTGLRFRPVPVANWSESLRIASEGQVAVISGDSADAILNRRFNPVPPYSHNPIVIIMDHRHNYVERLEEIREGRIAIIKDYGYTADIFKRYPEFHFVEVENIQQGLEGVSQGHYDAMLATMALASYQIAEMGLHNVKVVGKTPIVMDLTLFVDKREPLLHSIIDKTLRSLSTAESQEILQGWGRNPYVERIDHRLILQVSSVLLLILAVSMLWNYRLRREIRMRRAMERELRESREKLGGLFELSPLGIALTDMEGHYLEFNEAFRVICGYPAEELESLDYWTLTPREFEAREQEQLESLQRTGHYGPYEKAYRRKDGTLIPIRLNGMLVRDRQGRPHIWSIVEDVSDRKRAEQALVEARDQAEQASRAKGDFLAAMSHEIRTPMNTILGVADLLTQTGLNQEQRHYLELLLNAGDGLLRIINDILDMSKIESGRVNLETQPFSLRRVAYDAVEIVRPRAGEKDLQLLTYGFQELPRFVIGDPSRLRQVLINLVGNAVKFTESGVVALLAEGEQEGEHHWRVRLHVVDTGIGIPEEKQAQVFQEFTQAENSITRRYGGTGLGLSISRRLIHMMGGRLTLRSREGRGSTFSITLTVKEADPVEVPEAERELEGFTILTLHDHPIHSDFFEESLRAWGAKVTALQVQLEEEWPETVRHGYAGGPVDLLLIHHERLPGEELIAQLNKARRLPELANCVVAVSGDTPDRELPGRLHAHGAIFIPDRFDDEVLRRSIRAALEWGRRSRPEPSAAGEGLRILLAEDGEDNLALFRAYLAKQPHQVEVARNGEQAVRRFIEHDGDFDLVLMDIQMPVMDGYTATRTIRAWESERARRGKPIVALTAHALKSDEELSAAAGCDGHLTKPIRKAQLLEAITRFGARS